MTGTVYLDQLGADTTTTRADDLAAPAKVISAVAEVAILPLSADRQPGPLAVRQGANEARNNQGSSVICAAMGSMCRSPGRSLG